MNELNYKWIPIFADTNLHETIFNNFNILKLNKNSKILILWSWKWALDQRLIDNWYKNITAIDIEDYYQASNKNFLIKDLNKDFNDLWKYDIIFAIEIIEHLENHFHFIRNIKQCLTEEWLLFLSTPNIHRKSSRINYMLLNKMFHFWKEDIKTSWHINPVFEHLLKYNLNINNFEIEKKISNRQHFDIKRKITFKYLIYRSIFFILSMFIKWDDWVINIYIIKNNR